MFLNWSTVTAPPPQKKRRYGIYHIDLKPLQACKFGKLS